MAMSDDWRLRVGLFDQGTARALTERLSAEKLGEDLETSFGDRLVVSVDGPDVFVYAGTREQAERAERAIRSLAAEHGWDVEIELKRWHPTAEEWEDPDKPLPASDGDLAAEHEELIRREREEAREQGYPDFEVRVQCRSRSDAIALAERLRSEDIPSLRRWRYLLVGAADEDAAKELARRIAAESPPGAVVTTEGTGRAANEVRPGNPFAVFGGLGG
jgi:hypothetical protein